MHSALKCHQQWKTFQTFQLTSQITSSQTEFFELKTPYLNSQQKLSANWLETVENWVDNLVDNWANNWAEK